MIMVLLKVFLVLCFVAFEISLNVIAGADATSKSDIKIMERRDIYIKSSAYLELYFFFDKFHKLRVGKERGYLEKFVRKINDIFGTQRDLLHVTFTFLEARVFNPSKQAGTAAGDLNAEVLKRQLKKHATNVEMKWKKMHPSKPISAFIFVTTRAISNKTTNLIVSGISGRVGGICWLDEKVVAVTDDGQYSGVRAAALHLSLLMGAVYDGQGPPGNDFVKGSDGAASCKFNDGYLMGKWGNGERSFNLSTCTPHQHVMGLRQRGPGCYGTSQEKKNLLKTTK
uniref:Putative metalloprotease n=1 Tax=Ixodes ricinus TaxID=34613 RepID=A0A0K8RK92_IXORI